MSDEGVSRLRKAKIFRYRSLSRVQRRELNRQHDSAEQTRVQEPVRLSVTAIHHGAADSLLWLSFSV